MGPQCYKNKNIYKYPYPTGIPEMWNSLRFSNGIIKRWCQCNTGLDLEFGHVSRDQVVSCDTYNLCNADLPDNKQKVCMNNKFLLSEK